MLRLNKKEKRIASEEHECTAEIACLISRVVNSPNVLAPREFIHQVGRIKPQASAIALDPCSGDLPDVFGGKWREAHAICKKKGPPG